ncbi:MAG: hypothetical protein EP332_11140 [Bacteroidetes bacterium]|nr:MAG: hypothetical protein EP332_11140 [Bacteroidota bacterium]
MLLSALTKFRFLAIALVAVTFTSCASLSTFRLNEQTENWHFVEIRSAESEELFTQLQGALAYREWYMREMDHCRIKLSIDSKHVELGSRYSFHLSLPDTPMSLKARKSDCTEGPCFAPGQWMWDIGTRKHLSGFVGKLVVSIRNTQTGQEIGQGLLKLNPWQEGGDYSRPTQPLQVNFLFSCALAASILLIISRLFRI